LYSTGFTFKHPQSPIGCDFRLSTDLQNQPRSPVGMQPLQGALIQSPPLTADNQKARASKDMAFNREWVGSLGWGVTNPNNPFGVTERKCLED